MRTTMTLHAALRLLLAATLGLLPAPVMAQGAAGQLPTREGTCAATRIARLEHRLATGQGGPFVPGSGSAVVYANGGYQVGYEELPAIGRSRAGDPVTLCLIRIPRDCPKNDARGRVYTATNLRTMESWTLPDAEHGCGGA